jgi:hypothetical protein
VVATLTAAPPAVIVAVEATAEEVSSAPPAISSAMQSARENALRGRGPRWLTAITREA